MTAPEPLPTADGRDPCPFCGAIADALADPIVARLANRLCDELTVWRLRHDTPAHRLRRMHRAAGRLGPDRMGPKTLGSQRERALAELAGGPLRCREVAELVYPPTGDPAMRALNLRAANNLLQRLVASGRAVRVGYGWYALPGLTLGMREKTLAQRRDLLRRPGRTLEDIADRCGVSRQAVYKWLSRLGGRGEDVRWEPVLLRPPGRRARWVRRWWIEPAGRAGTAGAESVA